jgi:hypothetical protein
MSEPLKPCPFCGGPAEEDYYDGPLAQCEKCNAGADREAWQRRAPDADRAALRGLVRELYHAFAEFHRDDFGEDSEEWEHHRTHDDCWICALLARADAALAGEPGDSGELRGKLEVCRATLDTVKVERDTWKERANNVVALHINQMAEAQRAAERAAFVAGADWATGFEYAEYAEAAVEADRRYPEKPQEGKDA